MMRIDLGFERPLNRDAKTRLLLAIGALAKTGRNRFVRGDHGAQVFGEALGVRSLLEALAAEGVVPTTAVSSLEPAAAAIADEDPDGQKERIKAIGR